MSRIYLPKIVFGVVGLLVVLFVSNTLSVEQKIKLANTSTYTGPGRWDWTVFVVADQSALDSISHVQYTLHPTFPEPKRIVRTRENDFALSASGWGEFEIRARVLFKDSTVVAVEHWLNLEARSSRMAELQRLHALSPPPREERNEIITANTAIIMKGDRWEWTIYIASNDETLNQIECVEYILHPTYPDPKRKVCDKGATPGKGFFMTDTTWEPFTVGVRLLFKNGDTEYLKHELTPPFEESDK